MSAAALVAALLLAAGAAPPALEVRVARLEAGPSPAAGSGDPCAPALVHLVSVDTSRAEILLRDLRTPEGKGRRVTAAARGAGAIAAVNAGFFRPDLAPIGARVRGGTLRSPVLRKKRGTAIAWKERGGGWKIGRPEAFDPARAEEAVQAWPLLVEDGRARTLASTARAARTAIGLLPDGRVLLAVAEAPVLCGPTLGEWASFLARPAGAGGGGCVTALNLDGGSSSSLWVEGGVERGLARVSDALLVFPRR